MSQNRHPKLKKLFFNIRAIREFRNYSQEYLAAKMGISQNAYSKIELGYTNIAIMRVLDIADILDVNISDLLDMDLNKLQKLVPQKFVYN